eukprot:5240461-Amphidinium_carterae.3
MVCCLRHGYRPLSRKKHRSTVVYRAGFGTVWADGSGRHSNYPQHRCGVGYYTDTHERAWLPLPGIKQSVYRAEFLAVMRALEEF